MARTKKAAQPKASSGSGIRKRSEADKANQRAQQKPCVRCCIQNRGGNCSREMCMECCLAEGEGCSVHAKRAAKKESSTAARDERNK
eukprot:6044-Heterococcus_DN1.PRE.2